MRAILAVALLLVMVLGAAPVDAHRVNCFAAVEGERISGYAWMGGGARPKNVPYKVLAPNGTVLHQATTDENGEFSFAPMYACDHEIVVNAGEGHVARFTVSAAELPSSANETLPGLDRSESSGTDSLTTHRGTDELEEIIARAVSREVAPLRKELAEFQERERLQDVVAGIGFIAGIAGAAFFFLGVRRKNRD